MKRKIAENISDPFIKFNKTPINTGSSGHFDRKKTHQINVFYKSSTDNINIFKSLEKNKNKNKKQYIIHFNIFRNKDDYTFTGKKQN